MHSYSQEKSTFKGQVGFSLLQRCAHFDYRNDRSTILRFSMVILSLPQGNVAQYRPLN